MILAKQINAMISQENVDAETAMKKVAELETLVAQAKEVSKDSMNSLFIGAADRYQIAAKSMLVVSEITSRTLTRIKETSGRNHQLDG